MARSPVAKGDRAPEEAGSQVYIKNDADRIAVTGLLGDKEQGRRSLSLQTAGHPDALSPHSYC